MIPLSQCIFPVVCTVLSSAFGLPDLPPAPSALLPFFQVSLHIVSLVYIFFYPQYVLLPSDSWVTNYEEDIGMKRIKIPALFMSTSSAYPHGDLDTFLKNSEPVLTHLSSSFSYQFSRM